MLVLTRKRGESIIIDGNIRVCVIEHTRDKVRLGIDAPRTTTVHREEIEIEIQREKDKRNGNSGIY